MNYNKWATLFFVAVALLVYLKWPGEEQKGVNVNRVSGDSQLSENFDTNNTTTHDKYDSHSVSNVGVCSTKKGCAENKNLLPVMNPLFNMREVCKQCILLEDHLFQTKKRCNDCIKKHCLTIEGLLEEAITLDKENKHGLDKLGLPDKFRAIEKRFLQGDDPVNVAQSIRQIRKPLMNKYFDQF